MEEEDLCDACARSIAVARVKDPQGFASRRDALAELLFSPLPLLAATCIFVRTASSDSPSPHQHLCTDPLPAAAHVNQHHQPLHCGKGGCTAVAAPPQATTACRADAPSTTLARKAVPAAAHVDQHHQALHSGKGGHTAAAASPPQAAAACKAGAPSTELTRKAVPAAAHVDQHHQALQSSIGGRTAAAASPPQVAAHVDQHQKALHSHKGGYTAAAACRASAPSTALVAPPPPTGGSSMPYHEQKMEASKRKLRIGYEREEAAKRQHTICILHPSDVPPLQPKKCTSIVKKPRTGGMASYCKGPSSKMYHGFMGRSLTKAIVL